MAQENSEEDIITELQTRLDQLTTQFYASLKYVMTHHPPSAPSDLARAVVDPSSVPNPGTTTVPGSPPNAQTTTAEVPPASPFHKPIDATTFDQDQRELAVDLVQKQREIETLIHRLPRDLKGAEERQEGRISELKQEINEVEVEVRQVREKREALLEKVEGVIGRYKRI